jgi:hypothetical protein
MIHTNHVVKAIVQALFCSRVAPFHQHVTSVRWLQCSIKGSDTYSSRVLAGQHILEQYTMPIRARRRLDTRPILTVQMRQESRWCRFSNELTPAIAYHIRTVYRARMYRTYNNNTVVTANLLQTE